MHQIHRRDLIRASAAAAAAGGIGGAVAQSAPPVASSSSQAGPLTRIPRPELPYGHDHLAPHISAQTLKWHHGEHHVGYYTAMQRLAPALGMADLTLEEMVIASHRSKEGRRLFNAAAQVLNHNIYWNSMRKPGAAPIADSSDFARRVVADFGSQAELNKRLGDVAMAQFGSGWAWLVEDKKGVLSVVGTTGADCPITDGLKPLIVIDVWEHAYYVDYPAKRGPYVKAVVEQLLDWDFAASQYRKA